MKFACGRLENLEPNRPALIAKYFSFELGERQENTFAAFLHSLLAQLLEYQPKLIEDMEGTFSNLSLSQASDCPIWPSTQLEKPCTP
jgi:hypothetical protein